MSAEINNEKKTSEPSGKLPTSPIFVRRWTICGEGCGGIPITEGQTTAQCPKCGEVSKLVSFEEYDQDEGDIGEVAQMDDEQGGGRVSKIPKLTKKENQAFIETVEACAKYDLKDETMKTMLKIAFDELETLEKGELARMRADMKAKIPNYLLGWSNE